MVHTRRIHRTSIRITNLKIQNSCRPYQIVPLFHMIVANLYFFLLFCSDEKLIKPKCILYYCYLFGLLTISLYSKNYLRCWCLGLTMNYRREPALGECGRGETAAGQADCPRWKSNNHRCCQALPDLGHLIDRRVLVSLSSPRPGTLYFQTRHSRSPPSPHLIFKHRMRTEQYCTPTYTPSHSHPPTHAHRTHQILSYLSFSPTHTWTINKSRQIYLRDLPLYFSYFLLTCGFKFSKIQSLSEHKPFYSSTRHYSK